MKQEINCKIFLFCEKLHIFGKKSYMKESDKCGFSLSIMEEKL